MSDDDPTRLSDFIKPDPKPAPETRKDSTPGERVRAHRQKLRQPSRSSGSKRNKGANKFLWWTLFIIFLLIVLGD